MPKHTHLWQPPDAPMSGLSPQADFGRRLQELLIHKNMSQADLVRASNGDLSRSDISHYIRGKNLPVPAKLAAISAALKVPTGDLLSMRQRVETKAPDQPLMRVEAHTEDTAWLRINMAAPWDVAVEIQRLLTKGKKRDPDAQG